MKNLKSIRLQPAISLVNLDQKLWIPVLNFGRKKNEKFNFPLVFKDYDKAQELYQELDKLLGKTLAEVQLEAEALYDKFRDFDYRKMKCNFCGRTEVCPGAYPEGCFLEHQIAEKIKN